MTNAELYDYDLSGRIAMYDAAELAPTDFFDYDGALADLQEMYERGRKWLADNLQHRNVQAVYDHTLQIAYAMMDFREFATAQVVERFDGAATC